MIIKFENLSFFQWFFTPYACKIGQTISYKYGEWDIISAPIPITNSFAFYEGWELFTPGLNSKINFFSDNSFLLIKYCLDQNGIATLEETSIDKSSILNFSGLPDNYLFSDYFMNRTDWLAHKILFVDK